MKYDMMDDPYLQGSCSPTIREILHTIGSKTTLDDLCADLGLFEEDMTATPQPHSDHDYTSVPVADNEVTISDDIIFDCFGEYSDQPFDLVQETVISSTSLEEELQDVAEAIEKEFSRSSSMSPSLTESEMVSYFSKNLGFPHSRSCSTEFNLLGSFVLKIETWSPTQVTRNP